MKIKVKDKIFDILPEDELKIEEHLRDSVWCENFFGEDYYLVAFEPYEIIYDDGKN